MSPVDESRGPPVAGTIGVRARAGGPEGWGRAKALFLEALERPESEREAFIAAASGGDEELRAEVSSLLASEKAAAGFCETPAAQVLEVAESAADDDIRLTPGTRLGAYEITAFIAAGGMGAVYRARHTLLGREVAIKTIGARVADDAARRRLVREAKHASVLAHPNICAIHDVGEVDGVPFIVMEYMEGRTLTALVREAIPPLGDAFKYATQISSALEHAHTRGIIHRDLKSSNIMIRSTGDAMVLDFGLARRLPREGEQSLEATLTRPDALAGTLSHMAPEVLRGERADIRSDVWALGVLLYEMVTGELPFTGRTPFETSSAILGEPPRPMVGNVPLALRLVIERCLVKDPAGRYQSARAVADSLDAIRRRRAWPVVGRLLVSARRRTLYGAAAGVVVAALLAVTAVRLRDQFGATNRIATIAVLPFENATGDPGAGYYAEGITDGLIAQLGAATDIRVFSRASTTRATQRAKTANGIASQLGADIVAQGSVRRSPERIAIDISLIRPRDGSTIWSETYERDPREVLALEADVVRGLTGAIQLTMKPAARERLAAVRAVSPEVYEAYLKGRYEWNKRTQSSLQLAIAQFNRAVELDPTYAPAHAALADCFNQLGTVMVGSGSPREYRPRAAAEAIKALQIDQYSAEAHAALGYVWHYEWRWADAEKEFRRAIELNPSYSMAHIWYANMLMSKMRMDEAIRQVTAARELDPFSLIVNTNVAWVLTVAGRYEDAIAQLRQTLALDSSYLQAHWRLAGALASARQFDEALAEANRVVTMSNSSVPALAMLAIVEASAGRRRQAGTLLNELLVRSRHEYVPPALIALIFNELGDTDNTIVWLEKAFAEGSNAIAYLRPDYQNGPLRSDPRYQAMLTRAGLK
jgi:TolB-like protein/tetratricopeptide (TPR) repeat protein/predicted Ser/Thr protein kinase